MNNSPPSPQKKVFDVTRPGKTPAAPGSRPVIQSRKSIEDPDISSHQPLMNPRQKIEVKLAERKDEKPATQQAATQPTAPEPKKLEPAEPTPELQPDETPATNDPSPEPQPAESLPEPEQTETRHSNQPAPAKPNNTPVPEPPHEPLHMGMPGELSHGKAIVSHHRPRRHTLWLEILGVLLVIALLAAIINLLLDAGLIETNLNLPHTDLFEQT